MLSAAQHTTTLTTVQLEHFVGLLVAVSTLLLIVWRYLIRPLARLEQAMPTLLSIADQFTPNGGSSLRDVVNRLEDANEEQKASLVEQRAITQDLQTEMKDYVHARFHKMDNDLSKVLLAADTLTRFLASQKIILPPGEASEQEGP